jgi:hypothetical protein
LTTGGLISVGQIPHTSSSGLQTRSECERC